MARINMTATNTLTTHQSTFDDLLEAIRNAKITAPTTVPGHFSAEGEYFEETQLQWILGYVAKQLREQGIRFPKALVDAMTYYFKGDSRGEELLILWTTPEYIAEMLEANREIFEPVWRSGRFLPPFSFDFEDVSSKMQVLFLQMLSAAGIQKPGDYIFLSQGKKGYGYTDTLVLFVPISSKEYHMVALTVRKRRWYIPPSKALENPREMYRRTQKLGAKANRYRGKVANETYVMVGRYTNGVRGTFRRKGYSKSKRAVLVFDDRKRSWFILLLRFLRNLFSKRLNRQEESLGDKKPFGIVAQRLRLLRSYLSVLGKTLSCEV